MNHVDTSRTWKFERKTLFVSAAQLLLSDTLTQCSFRDNKRFVRTVVIERDWVHLEFESGLRESDIEVFHKVCISPFPSDYDKPDEIIWQPKGQSITLIINRGVMLEHVATIIAHVSRHTPIIHIRVGRTHAYPPVGKSEDYALSFAIMPFRHPHRTSQLSNEVNELATSLVALE